MPGMALARGVKQAILDMHNYRQYRYIVYKVDSEVSKLKIDNSVDVKSLSMMSTKDAWDNMLSKLPMNGSRLIAYYFEFSLDKIMYNKIILVTWKPDDAAEIEKGELTRGKKSLREECIEAIDQEVVGWSKSDLEYKKVLEKIKKFTLQNQD